ncbi:MAG TPA: M23 family metallopeptidase [Anaerovoracaceae bacterium]|nr:M23 family metallopeptidase [Anaerovoracaceae bacterium]
MKKSFGIITLFLIIAAFTSVLYMYQAEPDFLLDRFYDRIYADRLDAEPEVLLNETPVYYDLVENEWSIQKNSGKWFAPPKESDQTGAGNNETIPAVMTSLEDKLKVAVDKEPDLVNLRIIETDSGQAVLEQSAELPNLPLPGRNGKFTYELTMEWTGEANPYKGKYVLEIPVTADLPVKFVFSGQQLTPEQTLKLTQGQLLEVTVFNADGPEDIVFEQSIYSKFKWYQQGSLLRGYLPTNYNVKSGLYQINYGVKSKGIEFTQEIEIAEYNYEIQYLYVDPETEEETRNDAAYAEYNKYYIPVRNQSEPTRYYTEGFILPVKGRLTTEFGETRYVNDFPTSYRHLGLDIAAEEGTEVKAANRGKVVLARSFILTGNTVMIDHGEGIFSVYHHLLNLSVKAGEMAERGQKIGEVGSTGFSTGAHLHFMISHYLVNLEPGYFLVGQPITYENYTEFLQ